MRSSKSRSRSKANRPRSLGNVVNRVFDSSGPEGKVRGTPAQIIEKYQFLARDAQLSNDRVAAENFLQHAEHYTGFWPRRSARCRPSRKPASNFTSRTRMAVARAVPVSGTAIRTTVKAAATAIAKVAAKATAMATVMDRDGTAKEPRRKP